MVEMRRNARLLLIFIITTRHSLAQNQSVEKLPVCREVVLKEFYVMWTNIAAFTSLFKHVFYTGCLVCSRPICDFYSKDCKQKKSTLGRIPMYNNILEFGLSGKYFPSLATVTIYLNRKCYYKITVSKLTQRKEIFVRLMECYVQSNNCEDLKTYEITYKVEFDNQYCLYFGVAVYKPDRLHITSSSLCNTFASAFFNESVYFEMIDRESCFFHKLLHAPEAEFTFVQPRNLKERDFDGVPVIFPCSPGGFAVDPESGRFVTDKTCWIMFGDVANNSDVGIEFLLKNFYDNNENLLFPMHQYRPRRMRPIFIYPNGSVASRRAMRPIRKLNEEAVNKTRQTCQLKDIETSGEATDDNETDTSVSGQTTSVTSSEVGPTIQKIQCQQLISSVNQSVTEEFETGALNANIHNSTGCLICADLTDGNTANFSLPVYHNLLEFGFSGQYFPREAAVVVDKNPNCYIKIEILQDNGNITINLYECDKSNDDCDLMPVTENTDTILLNNWYCAQVGLALHDPRRIYYGFTFRCNVFGGSQFNESVFVSFSKSSCRNSIREKNANFELIQEDSSTINGVPIIVPCSSGGYVVNAQNGQFAVNETCDDMFWETLVNKTHLTGVHFILKHLFQSNEDFVFRKRGPNIPYPRPLYIKNNGKAMAPSEVRPRVVQNQERKKLFREKCLFRRLAQVGTTTESNGTLETLPERPITPTKKTTRETSAKPILSSAVVPPTKATSEGYSFSAFNFKMIAFLSLVNLKLKQLLIENMMGVMY